MSIRHLRALAHVAGMVISGFALMLASGDGRDGLAALAGASMGANTVLAIVDWRAGLREGDDGRPR